MSILRLEDLSYAIAGRPLLEHADLTLDSARHVGLIGRNGAGKSTLLKLITGQIRPDGGKIILGNQIRLGYVAQEAPGGDITPLEVVLNADTERSALLAAAENPGTPAETLAEIHERLQAIQAEAAPARAASILAGLGFNEEWQARPMSSYSGGWRMRVALAAVLFSQPDLLLLDEPTNHLDLEANFWLEGYLQKFPGAVLLVSHDRQLLDKTVDSIVHLDQGKFSITPGGFAEFVRIKTERAMQQAREAERIAAQRAHMQSFVDRFRAKATKARQAQSRLKALEKLPPLEAVVEAQPTIFNFPAPGEMPPPMLQFEGVEVGYDNQPILSGISLRIDQEDRIALLGQNGNGKSTLAKLLAGRLPARRGREFRGKGLRVGYFAQHQEDDLILTESSYEHLARALPQATPPQIRAQAARFGLDAERVHTKVAELSGGEKARLLLALATRDAPHLLILDEPTNHLDIDARDALIKALTDFAGAVVLISHDPYLVELAADRLFVVAGGKLTPYEGDLAAYAETLNNRSQATSRKKNEDKRPEKAARAEARARLAPLRQAARDAEAALNKLTAEKQKLETRLTDDSLYSPSKAAELAKITLRLGNLKNEIETAELAWLEAAEALEGAE